MGVSINGDSPKWMKWMASLMENSIDVDENWGYPHFRTPSR